MKSLPLVCLSLSLLGLVGCKGFRAQKQPSLRLPTLSKADHIVAPGPVAASGSAVTTFVDNSSWATCREGQVGSTEVVLTFKQKSFIVNAHLYPTANCTGDSYETYRVGEYRMGADQMLTANAFYPDAVVDTSGLLTFTGEVLAQAHADWTAGKDAKEIILALTEIKTVALKDLKAHQTDANAKSLAAHAIESTARVVLTRLDTWPVDTFGKLRAVGIDQNVAIPFDLETDADDWLKMKTGSAIDPACMTEYLYGTPKDLTAQLSDYVQKLLGSPTSHSELLKSGKMIKGVSIAKLDDKARNPYLLFYFYYSGGDDDDQPTSYALCPIKGRTSGLSFNAIEQN